MLGKGGIRLDALTEDKDRASNVSAMRCHKELPSLCEMLTSSRSQGIVGVMSP